MAKQIGPVFITGTISDICFYKMDGQYYARMKSSLSGKRVKKDPKFRRTMEYATLMAQASKIASGIYRLLPAEERKHALYRKMTGQALRMLKEGLEAGMVKSRLYEDYIALKVPVATTVTVQTGLSKIRREYFPVKRGLSISADGLLQADIKAPSDTDYPLIRGYPIPGCDENFVPLDRRL